MVESMGNKATIGSRNYARNLENGEVKFFTGSWSSGDRAQALWAFWRIPDGAVPRKFCGSLIGEDNEAYYLRCGAEARRHIGKGSDDLPSHVVREKLRSDVRNST
jgi:hypothetical protein